MPGFKNAKRFKGKIDKLPKAVAAAVREAMEEEAQEIVDAMKRLVPVDKGDLRDSINWCWGQPPRGSSGILSIGGGKGGAFNGNKISIFAGNDKAYYARFVEFGTHPHTQGGEFAGSQSPGTRAQPFFYPTWRAYKRRLKGRISRKVNAAIKKIAKEQG